jgi:glycosyltransferase involved in cell wall biosynthesis
MACNTATVLADATSLPEVGGDAARYFTPGDSDELASVLRELLADESQIASLSAAGLARSRDFSWQASAQATADAYRATLK